jgi:YwiC-like protein
MSTRGQTVPANASNQPKASSRAKASNRPKVYLPREHGATAMLLTPIFSAAILARTWRWSEIAVLTAAFAALSAKDPAVLLMRQRLVWKQRSPDSLAARQWLLGWCAVLIASLSILFATWPPKAFLAVGAGVAAFACVAIAVNLKNRQRSALFQIASAAALTSTSVATCIAATGSVAPWCWWFWALSAMEASAGILAVHARLDARIALRKATAASGQFRRAAQAAVGLLLCAAVAATILRRGWIALALALAAIGFAYELMMRQKDSAALQIALKTAGLQALMLSIVYSALLIAGLW